MRKLIFGLSIASVIVGQSAAFAIDFIVTPSLTIRETYSDNIFLRSAGEEIGAFVTEISPRISFRGINGGRLTTNFDYQLQTLFNSAKDVGGVGSGGNANTNAKTSIFHQLQFNSGYVVRRNRLNVGLRSSISQQNTTSIRAGDNINNLDNRTNIYTVGTYANWTPHFGSFADAVVNVDYNYVANDNAQLLSNSQNIRESVTVISGRDFSRISWIANFENSNEFRADGNDVQFQQSQATIRSWIDRYFNIFTTLGYANNSFQGLDNDSNGFFYTVGAQWRPNWWFNIEAGYGNNWHVTSNLNLSRRTNLSVGYFDRSVGLNRGGAWNASINHNTRNSFWSLSYTEDTITQQEIFEQPGFQSSGRDDLRNLGGNNLFTTTDGVVERKVLNASVSYTTGKSTFQLGGSYQKRHSLNNQQTGNTNVVTFTDETVYGVNGSWNWFFTRRISLYLSPFWQHINRTDVGNVKSEDKRYGVSARLTRTLPLDIGRFGLLNTSLEYQFLKNDSDLVVNNDPNGNIYTENRVTLSLSMSF